MDSLRGMGVCSFFHMISHYLEVVFGYYSGIMDGLFNLQYKLLDVESQCNSDMLLCYSMIPLQHGHFCNFSSTDMRAKLQWRHNGRGSVSNHQPQNWFYSTVYSDADQRKHQSSHATGLCAGKSPETGEFPAQMASNAENVSIWWRHHEYR